MAWDVVGTIVGALVVSVESVAGWGLSAATLGVEALEMIPGVGACLRWLINATTHAVHTALSLGDALLGLLGIRPEKKLRLCTILLADEAGRAVAATADVVALLQLCVNVYKRDANVRVIPTRPFKYTSGFAPTETVDASWVSLRTARSRASLLDVPSGAGALAADWGCVGALYQVESSRRCFFGSWRRVTGYGAPITCFVVRDVIGPSVCGATWITDYVTVQGDLVLPTPAQAASPRALAHAVGHACHLWHTCVDADDRNLMATQDACHPESETLPNRAAPRLSNWQVIKLRASKHVTYF